jgi:hypothetical protein
MPASRLRFLLVPVGRTSTQQTCSSLKSTGNQVPVPDSSGALDCATYLGGSACAFQTAPLMYISGMFCCGTPWIVYGSNGPCCAPKLSGCLLQRHGGILVLMLRFAKRCPTWTMIMWMQPLMTQLWSSDTRYSNTRSPRYVRRHNSTSTNIDKR